MLDRNFGKYFMKKVLITGAAGFIGFHLAKALIKRNDFVIGYDNFNDYYDPNLKISRKKILNELGISVIEGDIVNKEKLINIIKENDITHVVHLAAQAGVRHSLIFPEKYVHSNLEGFVSVLEACKNFKNVKFIFASSSSVYGSNKKIPFDVSDPTDSPSNLYGATKKANELIALTYHNLYEMQITGLRYFTVYGPWGRPDMAYYSFTKNILEKKPIKIFNNGKMKRDFTYIDDIINGTIAALDKCQGFNIYNLGNNNPVHLLHFIELLENRLNMKAIKTFTDKQPGEVTNTFAEISKSQNDLGFLPKTSIEHGINNFIDWYMEYHNI